MEIEKMPIEWRAGTIVPIPKKGDLMRCHNHRKITLLDTAYKILISIILKRLKVYTEKGGEHKTGLGQGNQR